MRTATRRLRRRASRRENLQPVAGTAFDFRATVPIGACLHDSDPQLLIGHGYDYNFVLNKLLDAMGLAARAYDPVNGRILKVSTTRPGRRVYTANALDGLVVGSSGGTYRQSDAFALGRNTSRTAPTSRSSDSRTEAWSDVRIDVPFSALKPMSPNGAIDRPGKLVDVRLPVNGRRRSALIHSYWRRSTTSAG
jgi:galactose mutarotase-like enzyme